MDNNVEDKENICDESSINERLSLSSSPSSVSTSPERHVLQQRPDIFKNYSTPCPQFKFSRRRFGTAPTKDFISNLDAHILRLIFLYLNKRDLCRTMAVCRRFYNIARDHSLWKSLNIQRKHLSEPILHGLIDRRIRVLNAASTSISYNELALWQSFNSHSLMPSSLTHLDLSMAYFASADILETLFSRCSQLKAVSLEQCYSINVSVLESLAMSKDLEILNLIMAKDVESDGLFALFLNCKKLKELNIGWIDFDAEIIEELLQGLPSTLLRLNLTGVGDLAAFNDDAVKAICKRCPRLEELDLSDCSLITDKSVEHMVALLPQLKVASLSRCYRIEPTTFMLFKNLTALNVFGCVTREGAEFLRTRLRPTLINASPLSTVARPSCDESMTTIWNQRTGEPY